MTKLHIPGTGSFNNTVRIPTPTKCMHLNIKQVFPFLVNNIKGKDVPRHTRKLYEAAEVWLETCSTSTPDGGELSTSHPGHFTNEESTFITHLSEVWWAPWSQSICFGHEKSLVLAMN
jgi:hypothetical protein